MLSLIDMERLNAGRTKPTPPVLMDGHYVLAVRGRGAVTYRGPTGPFTCDRAATSGWHERADAEEAAKMLRLTLPPSDDVSVETRNAHV